MKKNLLILMAVVAMFSTNVVAETKIGDIDANGKITATDSAYLLKKVKYADFKLPNEVGLGTSWFDMDGDGVLTANDAVCVLKKTVNKSEVLPAEKAPKKVVFSADDFEYGEYTSDIVVGNITITATKEDPIYVKDIVIADEVGEYSDDYSLESYNSKFKCMLLGRNNVIKLTTGNSEKKTTLFISPLYIW